MNFVYALLVTVCLTGCATSYQGSGIFSITGGYYEVPVTPELTKVVFSGNGYIKTETAAKYTLYRCAELAKEKDKEYFLIYQSLYHASLDEHTQQISLGAVGGKPVTHTYLRFLDSKIDGALVTADVLAEMEDMKRQNAAKNKAKEGA